MKIRSSEPCGHPARHPEVDKYPSTTMKKAYGCEAIKTSAYNRSMKNLQDSQ
jgi:hypothetical protein